MTLFGLNLLEWAQVFALVFAGLFFMVKLAQGWLMVNMSLSATTERYRGEDVDHDDLALSVTLTKGDNGSVFIMDTSVRVSTPEEEGKVSLAGGSLLQTPCCELTTPKEQEAKPQKLSLAGGHRLQTHSEPTTHIATPWKSSEKRQLCWLPPGKKRQLYRLPPGEGTTWSAHLTVPSRSVCTIEVVLLGRQGLSLFMAQWYCSVVSFPAEGGEPFGHAPAASVI
jgi:hypothetical protein